MAWKDGAKWVYSITYDEGCQDLLEHALPVHREYGVPGHVAVLSSQIGVPRDCPGSSYDGMMILSRAEHAAAIDKAVFPMMQGGPLMHAVAAKAVALKEAASAEYRKYAADVIANAQALTAGLAARLIRTEEQVIEVDVEAAQATLRVSARLDEARLPTVLSARK